MKKVLFLIHTLGAGGAEKVLVNLANGIDKSKYDVTVMTVIDTGIFRFDLDESVHYKTMFKLPFNKKQSDGKKASGSLQANPSKAKQTLVKAYQMFWRNADCSRIYRTFIKEEYDYEVAFLEGICAKIIACSPNRKSKKYAWLHVDIVNENKSDAMFKGIEEQKKCYGSFNRIVCVSKMVKDQAIKKLELPESQFTVIHNSIDTEEIVRKAKEFSVTNDKFTFTTVGRLAYQKGYDRLIAVVNKLVKEGFDFKVEIIGEGPEEPNLRHLVEEKGLEDTVLFLGFQSNPYPYINACDVFICPSRAEGFSTVASEAVVLKKSCIVTNCSGMEELFGKNSEYGLIVDNNSEEIYKGMKKILSDQAFYQELSDKALQNGDRFNLRKSVNNVETELFND